MVRALKAVLIDFGRFFNPVTRKGLLHSSVAIILLVGGAVIITSSQEVPSGTTAAKQSLVTLIRTDEAAANTSYSVVGTVRADAEVEVVTEAAGRLTTVPVSLGQTVGAGTVLVRIENSAAYASLLQAEGVYEAAQANSAIATVTEEEAQQAQRKAVADSTTDLQSITSELQALFTNELDIVFADPNDVYKTPGFISAYASPRLTYLRGAYSSLEKDLLFLREQSAQVDTADTSLSIMTKMREITKQYETVISTVRELVDEGSADAQFDAETAAFLTTVASVEQKTASINGRITNVQNTLAQAADTLRKAQLSVGNEAITTSGAQLKQALGSLRAAQSAYNKTIVTSPIAGTVSELLVSNGQTVSNGQVIATVTNDNAFEVVIFLTQTQAAQLTVGDEVVVDDYIGMVQSISPSLSSQTGKIEVRIQSTAAELISGETVTVTVEGKKEIVSTGTQSLLPLTAIKLSNTNASVYTVDENNVLVSHPVTLGRPQGNDVIVLEGLGELEAIVSDVRGLVAGQTVTVQ